MTYNAILDSRAGRPHRLIWLVRESVTDATHHAAYQPNDASGSVCMIAPDLNKLTVDLAWGSQPLEREAVAIALAELYGWAQSNQEEALNLGLIVAEDYPDEDLKVRSGLVITQGQLARLRKNQVALVLLAP